MSMKLYLATGEEVDLADFGHEHLVVLCTDLEAFRAIHDAMMADGALDKTRVTSDSGETIAVIHGMSIAGTQTVMNNDGSITGHFYMTGGTYDLGGEFAEAGRILLGEE